MANLDDVSKILTVLTRAYPRYELHPETIAVYCRLLADIDAGMLEAAALECTTKSQWFPSVYELRRAVVDLQKRGNRVPSAIEAWFEVLNAPANGELRQITGEQDQDGRWIILVQKHQFSHPLVESVARHLGWPGRFWTDSLVSDRSKFIAAYEGELERQSGDALSLPEVRAYTARMGAQPIQNLLSNILEKNHDGRP